MSAAVLPPHYLTVVSAHIPDVLLDDYADHRARRRALERLSGRRVRSLLFVGLTEALRVNAGTAHDPPMGLCLLVLVFWFKEGFAARHQRFWDMIGGAK